MPAPPNAESRPIRVLPSEVVDQIAAGEMVERPASVVRELIDNALDAGATEVSVELVGGGLELIRVADNGRGIPADQVELAFARHATSKIDSLDDLHALVTLGFRGEALSSIAAVAEVTLTTRMPRANIAAQVLATAEGVVRHEQAARQPGTTVTVRGLFARVPARRRFLEGPRAESARIGTVVRQMALGHPGIRFALTADGKVVFASRGAGDQRAALADVYGPSIAAGLRAFGAVGIDGFVSPRTLTRPDRRQVTMLVNGRLTGSPALLAALEAAYRPLLPRGRHPILLVRLTQPPEDVDANVHPTKAEVRLRREPELAERLAETLREALALSPDAPAADADFSLGPGQLSLPRPRHRVAESPNRSWRGEPEQPLGDALMSPRSLTQVQQALVLVEVDTGLFLVDQHRAHERIIYERLRASEVVGSQTLLEPVLLELKPQQVALVLERLPALRVLGFDCQHFGGHGFLVRSAPVVEGAEDLAEALPGLITEAASPDDRWQARLLASLACRGAIRRGRALTEPEIRHLLADLALTDTPAACPHGSPVILHFSGDFLRRQFRW